MNDYWAAMAQVMPVVALGIALEARTISAGWDENTPRWRRGIQSAIWVVTLVPLALGELVALGALRGQSVSPGWFTACEAAVGAGMSILVLSPAIEVVLRGHAEAAARLLSWDPFGRLRLWLADRTILRLIKKTEQARAYGDVLAYEGLAIARQGRADLEVDEDRVARLEQRLTDSESRLQPEAMARLEKARKAIDARRSHLAEFESQRLKVILERRADRQKLAVDKADYMRIRVKYLEGWRTATQEDRQRLTEYFRRFSIASQPPSDSERPPVPPSGAPRERSGPDPSG